MSAPANWNTPFAMPPTPFAIPPTLEANPLAAYPATFAASAHISPLLILTATSWSRIPPDAQKRNSFGGRSFRPFPKPLPCSFRCLGLPPKVTNSLLFRLIIRKVFAFHFFTDTLYKHHPTCVSICHEKFFLYSAVLFASCATGVLQDVVRGSPSSPSTTTTSSKSPPKPTTPSRTRSAKRFLD